MFGSIGSYLYDRRRGLLKSAGLIGTVYLAGKYAIQRLEEIKEAVITERNAKENLRRRFQQNMQDCTYTIMAYMPTLASRIFEELDVERISLELQRRSNKPIGKPNEATSSEGTSESANNAHLSPSQISAAEPEASSPISAFSSLSEKEHIVSNGSPSVVQSFGQHTSSFLSALESTELLSSSLPLSSETPYSPSQANPLAESTTSWVKFNHESSQASGSGDADDEKATKPEQSFDNVPVIPDLDLPAMDLSAVSIVDTQTATSMRLSEALQSSDSALSHTDDIHDGRGSLQRKTKAELWHELKITTFTRVLVVLYSTTLLSLQIHVQLNLIGRYKYVQSIREMEKQERQREKERNNEEDSFDSFGLVGSLVASVAPAISSTLGMNLASLGLQNDEQQEDGDHWDQVDEDIERKYLTLAWWLLHIGWRDVASRVRNAVEDVLQGVSLKSRLNMAELRDLINQIRKKVEFLPDGQERSDITSAIFPLSPSAEQNVLIQGGISPHLATIDPPLRALLEETKAYVKSPDFELVWGHALDRACDLVMSGLEREIFGEVPAIQVVEESANAQSSEDRRERLAGILPGLARWCHPALFGLPNELVEALGSMREVAGLSAIIYSSYNNSATL